MHTDQDSTDPHADGLNDGVDDTPEESLGWLLDLDRAEPEEKLFAVDAGEYLEEDLTEYETELAGRPLTRGSAGGEDLSMFVSEEIVVSADARNGGIYHDSGSADNAGSARNASAGAAKAIDHSRRTEQSSSVASPGVEDGSDILGLVDDDDMGEKFLSIKRVKSTVEESVSESVQAPVLDFEATATGPAMVESVALAAGDTPSLVESRAWPKDEALTFDEGLHGEDLAALAVDAGASELELLADAADADDIGAEFELDDSLPQSGQASAEDWLADIDLELAVPGEEQESEPQLTIASADDWLDDVGLELVVEGEEDEPVIVTPETLQSSADDWLDDVGLELVDPGAESVAPAESEVVKAFAHDGLEDVDIDLADFVVAEESVAPEVIKALNEDWLGDDDMDLSAFGSTEDDVAPAAVKAESDDWLGDVDMDLAAFGSEQDAAVSDGMELESEGWLGDDDLDLTSFGLDERDAASDDAASDDAASEDVGLVAHLTEAPAISQVVDPEYHNVANEVPESPVDSLEALDSSAAGDNVQDYVARNLAPLDDEAFDEYLLRGAQLLTVAADPEELRVERTEGIVSVDPTPGAPIDYHDDFRALDGFESAAVGAITPVISALVDEVAGLAKIRMAELDQVGATIEVDVMLGADSGSIAQCLAEGYQPVAVICPELPAALGSLDAMAVDVVYVRLFDGQTNENRNDLFLPQQEAVATFDDLVQSEEIATQVPLESSAAEESTLAELRGEDFDLDNFAVELIADEEPIAEEVATDELATSELFVGDTLPENASLDEVLSDGDVFGDDLFDEDAIDAEFASTSDGDALSGDIDALFADIEHGSDEVVGDQLPELPTLEADPADEQAQLDEATCVAATVDEDDPGFGGDAGFGEDIFSAELSGELPEFPGDEAADIDSVFAGLAMGDSDSDEICGLDVDEFDQAGDIEVMEAVVEFGEPVPAASAVLDDSDMAWCIPESIAFNYTSASGNEVFSDFLDAFIEEGTANVEKLEDAIGEWERDVSSEAAFAPVMRLLHTLKGIGKGVGLQRYGTLIHNFETLLEKLPRPEQGAEADYFRIVNAWLDASVRGLEFVREHRADISSELPGQSIQPTVAEKIITEESTSQSEPESGHGVSQRAADRQKKRDQQLADEGAKVLAAQQSVRITSEKLDHLLNLTNQAQQLGVRSAQSTTRSKRASAELQGRLSSVRTHISKIADRALLNVTATGGQQPSSELDALEMDQYSELQEAASILSEAVEDLTDLVEVSNRHNTVLEALLKQQATVISTIGSSIQAARVVPVSRLMPGLRRIVRTVSSDLDKTVAFKVLNETGALDRDHYARCQVVLEHMVRNALDHGIESPEERLAVGKATTGRITIDVRKSGGDYYITLTDDGRGIDPYEMRESAFRKGLDVDVDALSDDELINLIFHKGFSTAAAVSEISGRGVGMDIVVSELQQIGGDVKVHSTVGQGTTFEVHIPSHVSVNGALFVTAGQSSYAIPLNGLLAVEHVPVDDFFNAVERGSTLTVADVDCEPAYLATLCHGESLPDRESWGSSVPVIIAGSEKRYMAIAIDNLEEALELVIRSLGPQFANVPGVAGAATTADGEAVVALDLNVLVASVSAGSLSPLSVDSSKAKTMLALVVDDSRTQRMVTTSQFDTVGVETITAENGLVAIDLLNTTHRLPDVVLLDVEMPVKDGIETLREIRKSMRYKHLPVIMVTSRTGAKHRALAEEAGCDGYMGKPFNFPGLIKQINQLTGYELTVS